MTILKLHTDKSYEYLPIILSDETCLKRLEKYQFDTKLRDRGESGLIYYSKAHHVVLKVSPIGVPNFFDLCDVQHYDKNICSTTVSKRKFNQEMDIAQEAGTLGIGPKFYDTFYAEATSEAHRKVLGLETITVGLTITERYDVTLMKYLKTHKTETKLIKKLQRLFTIMQKHKLEPNDLHTNNIMLNTDTLKVVIVDFGYFKKSLTMKSDSFYDRKFNELLIEIT